MIDRDYFFICLIAIFMLSESPVARAQGCGPSNPNCVVPTRPNGTCDSTAASTQFVCNNGGGGGSLTITDGTTAVVNVTHILFNGAVVSGTTPNGVVTITAGGTGTVTQINQGNGIVLTPSPITTTGSVAADIATTSNIFAGTANKMIDSAGAQASLVPTALTISTATFTPDSTLGIDFDVTLVHASCPCTIANLSTPVAGFYGLTVRQSSTGSDTIGTWGTIYKFPGGTVPTLSTGANAVDDFQLKCFKNPPSAGAVNFCEVTTSGLNFQ